jgi:DNA-binding PadR family transcriptional regulator
MVLVRESGSVSSDQVFIGRGGHERALRTMENEVRCWVEMGESAVTDRSTAAMRSPVSWALLGLVIERPSYGYELVQRFERTYGDALELSSPSQVYTALDALSRRTLIEELPPEYTPGGVVRQPKPHYRATEEGERSYQEWLIAQVHEERRRSRLFARQLAVLAPKAALAVIERYEHACLEEAKKTPLAGTAMPSSESAAGLASRLVGEEERLAVETRLSWIEYARREFRELASGRAPRP